MRLLIIWVVVRRFGLLRLFWRMEYWWIVSCVFMKRWVVWKWLWIMYLRRLCWGFVEIGCIGNQLCLRVGLCYR